MIVRELLAKFGVSYDDSGARKADADVGALSGGFKALIGIVGGAAFVRGFGHFLTQQVEIADQIGDTAERLGVGVAALQELRFAGEDVGVSMEGVDAALARMVRGMSEAKKGQGEAKDAFKEMGVSLVDAHGNLRDFDDVLTQVADGMGNAKTDADRMRLGFAIFGREGSKFAATMKNGSAGIEEMRQKARDLGGVLSVEQVDAADKADKAINGFNLALRGFKHTIASEFIPKLTEALEKLSRWFGPLKELVRTSYIVEAALIAVGGALAYMFGASRLLALTKAGIAFALIALAIDDIITFVSGGDSALGRFIDQFKGMGSSVVVLENWKAGMKILGDYAQAFYKDLLAGWEIIQKINAQRAKEKEAGRRAEFDSEHAQWERRKKWVDEHPNAPEFLRQLGKEPVWKPTAPGGGDAWEELRTRQVATEQGMNAPSQSAEDIARARTAPAQALAPGGAGAAGHTNVQQTVNVNVNGAGADAKEHARKIAHHVRKALNENNAQTLRALRQVPAR